MTKSRATTAAEFKAELANDPTYQRMIRRKEEERKKLELVLNSDQRELIQSCCEVGVPIQSVWDLVNTTEHYPLAIPILVKHLEIEHHPRILEGIVRALITTDSRGVAFNALVKLFNQTTDSESDLKWLLGMAIAESATKSELDTIVELANDCRHGKRGREHLPLGLLIAGKEAATPILNDWLSDPVLSKNAKKAIGLFRKGTGAGPRNR